jgi:hypothetical protein
MAISKINTRALANDSVTTDKVADNAITTDMVASGEIGVTDLADGSITNAKISATAAIAPSKIDMASVTALTMSGHLSGDTATFTGDIAINNGSPELYFGTTGTHYNWMLAAQENLDQAFEISVGSQDTDYSNDTYSKVVTVKADGNMDLVTGGLKVGGTTVINSSRQAFFTAATGSSLKLERSDVGHGMTAIAETATFGHLTAEGGANGGLRITALADTASTSAFNVSAYAHTPSTDGNAAVIRLRGSKKNGTGEQAIADSEDLLSIGNVGTERIIVKGNGDFQVNGTTVINSSQVGFLNEKTRIGTGATYPTDNAQLYIQRSNNNPYIGFFSNDGSRNAYLQSNGSGAFYLNNGEGGGWAFNNSTSDVLSISNSGALTATSAEITLGNSLKLQNVAGNGYATIQNAGAGTNTDLGFSTGGSTRMTITSGGNVGIGESNTTALANNLGTLLNVNSASIIGNSDAGAYFAYNARYNNSWLRTETSGVGIISLTNTGKLTYRTAASGNAETVPTLTEIIRTGDEDPSYVTFDGASQVRLTLGSEGTPGTNNANWIRGNAGYLQYNSASNDHSWEVGGTERMRLTSGGVLHLQRGAVWNESTQGFTKGAIHIDPNSDVDHTGGAITFGSSDHGSGETPHAGIYTRSDGTYGTKMYISTTDSYATGPKTAIKVDEAGRVTTPKQPAFSVYKNNGGVAATNTVIWNATYVNTGGHLNNLNGVFTAPVAGQYFFNVTALSTNAEDRFDLKLVKNNSQIQEVRYHPNAAGGHNTLNMTCIITLSANDGVSVLVTVGEMYGAGSTWNRFSGYLIG